MDKAPREMAEWIVGEWRSVRGSDRMLVIAITEALKVIPAAVGDLEAEIAELREGIETFGQHRPHCSFVEPSGCTCGLYDLWRGLCRSCHGAGTHCVAPGEVYSDAPCGDCKGTGKLHVSGAT